MCCVLAAGAARCHGTVFSSFAAARTFSPVGIPASAPPNPPGNSFFFKDAAVAFVLALPTKLPARPEKSGALAGMAP